jgi:hypothetical protein
MGRTGRVIRDRSDTLLLIEELVTKVKRAKKARAALRLKPQEYSCMIHGLECLAHSIRCFGTEGDGQEV